MKKLESEWSTTYREEDPGTSSPEEESEDSSSFDEGEQSSKKDSISGDTGLTDEETE